MLPDRYMNGLTKSTENWMVQTEIHCETRGGEKNGGWGVGAKGLGAETEQLKKNGGGVVWCGWVVECGCRQCFGGVQASNRRTVSGGK